MEESLTVKGLGGCGWCSLGGAIRKKFRVTVHNRWTFPALAEHGLDIRPNTATNVAIERVSLVLIHKNVFISSKNR